MGFLLPEAPNWAHTPNLCKGVSQSHSLFLCLCPILLASSLMCFHCDSEETNWNCLNMKTCEDTDSYCITKYFGGGIGKYLDDAAIFLELHQALPEIRPYLRLSRVSGRAQN